MRTSILLILYLSSLLSTYSTAVATIEQDAYIWQRTWSEKLERALIEHVNELNGFTVLAAEITPTPEGAQVSFCSIDFPTLVDCQLPITLAIRVGQYPGPFSNDAPTTQTLLKLVREVLQRAQQAGVEPAAIEIDFDCATSKLTGYQHWLQQLRIQLGTTPLSITTLPTWMTRPDNFRQLVHTADRYVLQVHSIQRPTFSSKAIKLCDAKLALKWAQQADAFGQTFQVALPTYGYLLGYNADGELISVSAEDTAATQGNDQHYKEVRSDPIEMAQLVCRFNELPLPNCSGIIWYRLPVGEERLNWDAATWRAVRLGQGILPNWRASVVTQSDGLVEILLEQSSPIASDPPDKVTLHWQGAAAIAWDGQRNFTVTHSGENALEWKRPSNSPPLSQGESWTLGWVRFAQTPSLSLTVTP
ncbi:DUF3142 domain-containing protein [Cerasicoccus frondis]|uniref:DUF3142 domain-containing protein n=1 Tax=Cerasicoccus frondis TaxID=490090 RepID=UPI0028525E58|nr:DUF3142 domain-containing protein [Cerasicoccus frondis]